MCTLCGSKAMDYTTSFHTNTYTHTRRMGPWWYRFSSYTKGSFSQDHSVNLTGRYWLDFLPVLFKITPSFFLAYSAKFVLMIDTSCACCPDYEDISMIITFWHAWTWPLVTYSCICLFLNISVYTQTTYLTIWFKRIDAFKQSNLINANEQVYFDISYLVGMKIHSPFLELIFLN